MALAAKTNIEVIKKDVEIAAIAQQTSVANVKEIVSKLPSEIELWSAWNNKEDKKLFQEVLLRGRDVTSENVRERILEYISARRSSAISFVDSLPIEFNLTALTQAPTP
ncbi:MAG: hypothetical protein UF218_03400 [Eggerthellaceae bacterium]|nr:hypothetical protein [Eggerthellaceae bacterium]